VSSIITASQKFRSEVLRRDRDALRQLSSAYSEIERRLKLDLDALMRDIAEAQRQGKTVNRNWLRRSVRYQSLIRQAKIEISAYSNGALRFIEAKQRQAIDLGQSHAADLIQRAADLSFARLPSEAVQEMVGVLEDGSPLSKVLDRLGGEAAGEIRGALIEGIGSGKGVAPIARKLRSVIDAPRWKALQVARTETMRAYRASTLRTYAENSDVLDGWTWLSTLSTRTCLACWSLHGTFFPLSKQFFPAHVSCRCTSIPSVKGSDFNITAGSVAFAKLPAAQQQTILGSSRYEMYSKGTALDDFVILTRDKDWGGAYQVRPLWKMKSRRRAA
jgi:SPP1 gp7 family putative phage head morphogenesis protein